MLKFKSKNYQFQLVLKYFSLEFFKFLKILIKIFNLLDLDSP